MKSTDRWWSAPALVAFSPLALLLASASVASASMAIAVSLQELVERADHIVVASAVAKHCLHDDRGRIVTDVEVVVERSEKGPTREGDTLLVRTLGGEVDGIATQVVGAPSFKVGQRQLLFAIDDPGGAGVVHTLELSQGLMRLFERDGEAWVHAGGEGLALRKRDDDGRLRAAKVPADQPLAQLLDEVRDLLAGDAP